MFDPSHKYCVVNGIWCCVGCHRSIVVYAPKPATSHNTTGINPERDDLDDLFTSPFRKENLQRNAYNNALLCGMCWKETFFTTAFASCGHETLFYNLHQLLNRLCLHDDLQNTNGHGSNSWEKCYQRDQSSDTYWYTLSL